MKKLGEKELFQGKRIKVLEATFEDDRGKVHTWERFERTDSNKSVVIFATLKQSDRLVLLKQFRQGINGWVTSLPAGMCEDCSIEEDAIRELKEETGYRGKVIDVSPPLASYPAMTDSLMQVVTIEVDESLLENQNPNQSLECGEEIEVVLVEKSKVKEFLLTEYQNGVAIGSLLWYRFGISL
ncbi:MAG: NUDIX hydrolase [Fibrobacterales bacterium]